MMYNKMLYFDLVNLNMNNTNNYNAISLSIFKKKFITNFFNFSLGHKSNC